MLRTAGDDEHRVNTAFRRCTSRLPYANESAVLLQLLNTERQRFAGDEPQAWQTASDDPAHPPALPPGATAADAAAWTGVCRVLLNLDETISRE